MFGVNLPLKVPFFAAICTSSVLGAIIGANAGTPPTPTLPNTLLAPIMAPKTLDVQIAAKKGT
jgi:phosphotransferase system  glucose/maltose/N-acetylglucosamine-specific IIC component